MAYAIVPHPWGRFKDLIHGTLTTTAPSTSYSIRGEAYGPVTRLNNGVNFPNGTLYGPSTTPLSVFAYVVRRDALTSTSQALIGNGYLAGNGWTFWLTTGTNTLGFTRWGIADNHSTLVVPVSGVPASAIGISHNGSTCRYFMNGIFENVASGGAAAGGSLYGIGANPNTGSFGISNSSIYVIYVWNRALRDDEMRRLAIDPWGPIRPQPSRTGYHALGGETGTTRFTQAIAEAVITADAGALRVTQILAEVLVPQVGAVRATQLIAEVIYQDTTGTGRTRITQAVSEVVHSPTPSVRATQLLAEIVLSPTVVLRATQLVSEVVLQPTPAVRATQLVSEVVYSVPPLTLTYKGQLFPKGSSLIKPA